MTVDISEFTTVGFLEVRLLVLPTSAPASVFLCMVSDNFIDLLFLVVEVGDVGQIFLLGMLARTINLFLFDLLQRFLFLSGLLSE